MAEYRITWNPDGSTNAWVPIEPHYAIHAAQHVPNWGHDAARRYALNRGVPARMFEIANEFESRRVKQP